MWVWVGKLVGLFLSAVKPVIFYLAAFSMGRKRERSEQKQKQVEDEYEALAKTTAARRDVDDSPTSVRGDPRNRDKS